MSTWEFSSNEVKSLFKKNSERVFLYSEVKILHIDIPFRPYIYQPEGIKNSYTNDATQ